MSQIIKRPFRSILRKIADAAGLSQLSQDVRELRKLCLEIQHQTSISPDGLPIPPPQLHFLVSGNDRLDLKDFFEVGRGCAEAVTSLLKKQKLDIDSFESILDFGCGCGRVIRHFHSLKHARVYGTDYNAQLVEWCNNNLKFGDFAVNDLKPPLTYSTGKFDLVYAFSVFTHLPESLQAPWLSELARVTKPGGYVVITTHGTPFAEAYLTPREREQFRSGRMVVHAEGLPGENKCGAYHPEEYVRNTLAADFEVLDFVPGQVIDASRRIFGQDAFVLQKHVTA
jgi:SAM-dependent methyltransferase